MERLATLLVKRGKWIAGVFLLLAGVLGVFVPRFKIDASADTLLLKGNTHYFRTQVMNQRFNPQEFLLVAYQPHSAELFSEQSFELLKRLTEELQTLPRVQSATSMLTVPLLSQASSLSGEIDPKNYTYAALGLSPSELKTVLRDHPLFQDLLVNQALDAASIQLVFKADPQIQQLQEQIVAIQAQQLQGQLSDAQQQQLQQLQDELAPLQQQLDQQREQEVSKIREITAAYAADGEIFLGGNQALSVALIDIIGKDLRIFGSAIAAVISLLLLVLLRQWRWVLIPISCCAVSVAMTLGLFGLLDLRATVISSNFVALQLILTLAIVIHLIVEYRQILAADSNLSQSEALTNTLNKKIVPCLYAGLTTSVGFGSLIFSGIQPVIAFGWMMIVAMAVSILTSLILFPAILSLFTHQQRSYQASMVGLVLVWARAIVQHPKMVITATVVAVAVIVAGLPRLSVENSFLNYFREGTQIRKELVFIDREFGGSTPLDLIWTLPAEESTDDLVLSAAAVQQAQRIQHVLQQYQAMGNVSSVVNFTELAKLANQNQPLTEYELTAVYRLIDEDMRDRLLGSYFASEHRQLRLSMRIQDSTQGFERTSFLQQVENDIEALGVATQSFHFTNLFVLYQDILQRLFDSQVNTLALVFAALLIMLWLLFRSIKVAMIALVPNVLCTFAVLAIMGWAKIPLDLMTITIAAIAMGIAVDDTIHFVHRYLAERGTENPVKRTLNSVGYAIFYTTCIIAAGFSLLAFSDFVPSILFGLLTAAGLVLAMVIDCTLLPVLLQRFCPGDKLNTRTTGKQEY